MAETSDFYVGYLRMPGQLAAFLRWAVPGAIVGGLALAWLVSRRQNDPGDGVWHYETRTLVGRVSTRPYPLIRTASDRPDGSLETILLVSQGKQGGAAGIAGLDGRWARVRGTILQRDGLRLLELAEAGSPLADDAVDAARNEGPVGPTVVSLGTVTLSGEIIDPKCYSGAMKPGEGKTHKECATLCIAGGIPPMFVTFDPAGGRSYYLLTDRDGRALDDRILPFIADPVEITGTLERRDDLQVLRLDPENIRRQ